MGKERQDMLWQAKRKTLNISSCQLAETSSQKAELIALTRSLTLGKEKKDLTPSSVEFQQGLGGSAG
jgi:hypothetical protein